MMKLRHLFAMAVVVAAWTAVPAGAAEAVKIEGGGAAIAGVFGPCHAAYEEETGVDLSITTSTPGRALIALEKGQVDVAAGAVPLEYIMREAEKLGVKVDPTSLQVTAFANNPTVVFLNRENPVRALSKEQLKGIFSGKVVNWREVGGKDLPIEVVWGKGTPGQNALFKQLILDGEKVTPYKTKTTDYEAIRAFVLSHPGAIGIDPEGLKSSGINVPRTPVLSYPVLAITKGAPSAKVKKLFDYIKMTELND